MPVALFSCYIVLLEEEKQVFLVSDRLPLCADPYVKVLTCGREFNQVTTGLLIVYTVCVQDSQKAVVVVFEPLFLQHTPAVFGSAGDHTQSCSRPPAELCPQLWIDSAHLECRAVCIFSPYSEQAPSGLVFKSIAKLF